MKTIRRDGLGCRSAAAPWIIFLFASCPVGGNLSAAPRVPGPPTPENPPIFHEGFDEYYFAGATKR